MSQPPEPTHMSQPPRAYHSRVALHELMNLGNHLDILVVIFTKLQESKNDEWDWSDKREIKDKKKKEYL